MKLRRHVSDADRRARYGSRTRQWALVAMCVGLADVAVFFVLWIGGWLPVPGLIAFYGVAMAEYLPAVLWLQAHPGPSPRPPQRAIPQHPENVRR